ncbi:FtsK/SpoIIIE domain-containing protein [Galbitalea sp. SE-J8]|uniref:FtsK/SpoIIIE domain-containing protein n=1 Tax=Galbitalea sp. SE-J8 TaxID=3054952 RepID=UPI00259CE0F3|nr:FtsK/SpoIIIE domain-containing protein [Galbitalea sp. SE-J8]MDM4763482.1 FtsK/SpoIIIE domain-containing protein [Galbitalea sp. SE-J8]
MRTIDPTERIPAPNPVQDAPRPPSPLVAAVAPVVVSLVLWAVTRSAFALVFAALGPLVAVGTLVDGRWGARRQRRREAARFAAELTRSVERVERAHAEERRRLDAERPDLAALVARGGHDPDRWTSSLDDVRVVLGRGRRPSAVRLDVAVRALDDDPRLDALARRAAELGDAPLVAAGGIAVVGPAPLARAVARGYLLQLAIRLDPAAHVLVVPEGADAGAGAEAAWLARLPHPLVRDPAVPDGEVRVRGTAGELVVAIAPRPDRAPARCRTVVDLTAAPVLARHDDRELAGPLDVEPVSAPLAARRAEQLARSAGRARGRAAPEPPAAAAFADLAAALGTDAARAGLAAPLGLAAAGRPLWVDLVRDGPHAVVGGTTGSGKSELLVAWVLALAAGRSPAEVTFLLVDFKGGAAFAPLADLPHCVGVITDLSPVTAARALASLRAEVRVRERELALAAARSIDELPEGVLARLVIVVDEYAAVVAGDPELHALFTDLAARGRSLGIHLVLCTQRPAGVVRDGVLANVDLRVSLRVNNRADSAAVLGTDAAAAIPAARPGRALVAVAGAEPVPVQVALATAADAHRIAAATPGPHDGVRRPWLDPLPETLPLATLARLAPPSGAIVLGLADRPAEQAQPPVLWRPAADGHLLVLGAASSGRTAALATIAAQAGASVVVPGDVEGAWDVVTTLAAAVESGRRLDTVVLIDDVDAVLARMPDEHALAFADALGTVLRSGRAAGVGVALTAQRLHGALASIAALCDRRLTLRMPSRQDHLLAGAAAECFDAAAPPGRGSLDGCWVQVAGVDAALPAPAATAVPELDLAGEPLLAVVAAAPAPVRRALRAAGFAVVEADAGRPAVEAALGRGGERLAALGDPAAWQSAWGLLPAVAERARVLLVGCSPADVRGALRTRELPPPVAAGADRALALDPDGVPVRVRLRWPIRQRSADVATESVG